MKISYENGAYIIIILFHTSHSMFVQESNLATAVL